jgi:trehalose 6-phosphate synthase/phosphatase
MDAKRHRLIVVSNRLPLVFKKDAEGQWHAESGSGGLVSALVPVLRNRGGTWIGWPGTAEADGELDQALADASQEAGYTLRPVSLTPEDVRDFYLGFSNEVVWPLFHDLPSLCNFEPAYWRAYQSVNRKYAQAIIDNRVRDTDFIWVHDYHLMNVALELRTLKCMARTGFFLHIPFPPPDLFLKMPWCRQIISALLAFDLVGFQTLRDRRNFVQCVRALGAQAEFEGRGQMITARVGTRVVRIGAFPISIDFKDYARRAAAPEVAAKVADLRRLLPKCNLVLGIDRLDYTKGIPHRLRAFQSLMQRHPELRERISLIQVVVPSRVDIPSYNDLKLNIEQLVTQINGEFQRPGGWVPVWYVYGSLTSLELLAYYRAADIALITPLKDGMNLVAKEYCACSVESDCVLILSQFAGAAAQLGEGAILVNPFDIEGVADAIQQAECMEPGERRARMRRMRHSIRRSDIYDWVNTFMKAAFASDLSAFPLPEHPLASVDGEVPVL